MLKYNVSLLNNDCLFDSKDGFDDFSKAVEWSAGRGDKYVVNIEIEKDNEIIGIGHYCWKDGNFYEKTMDVWKVVI